MPERTPVSDSDYLRAERDSATKHEFLRGEVYATAGGTPEHAALEGVKLEVDRIYRDPLAP